MSDEGLKKKYNFQRHETYAPLGFARLVLNDVFNIQQRAQVVSLQSLVFPGAPRVHFRVVPWYLKTSLPTVFLSINLVRDVRN